MNLSLAGEQTKMVSWQLAPPSPQPHDLFFATPPIQHERDQMLIPGWDEPGSKGDVSFAAGVGEAFDLAVSFTA